MFNSRLRQVQAQLKATQLELASVKSGLDRTIADRDGMQDKLETALAKINKQSKQLTNVSNELAEERQTTAVLSTDMEKSNGLEITLRGERDDLQRTLKRYEDSLAAALQQATSM
ncbi:MAG: hypothetical protein WB709_03795, partial [Solirubrobacteraceae bacterium]